MKEEKKVKSAENTITLSTTATTAEVEASPAEVLETKKILVEEKPKKVRIIIAEQEGEENQGDVFVSVNGFPYQIKRGFEVEVPESVVEVLRHAITTKMTQDAYTQAMTYKDVPRFSFQVLG